LEKHFCWEVLENYVGQKLTNTDNHRHVSTANRSVTTGLLQMKLLCQKFEKKNMMTFLSITALATS